MIIIVPHSAKFLHKRVLSAAMQYVDVHSGELFLIQHH